MIFKKNILLASALVGCFLVSCDKDFIEIGTNVIGQPNFELDKDDQATVIAYNKALGYVQSNNVDLVPFGIYNHPNFEKVVTHYVTQIELPTSGTTGAFSTGLQLPQIKNVVLYVPYFSRRITTENQDSTYELDSIFGTQSTFKINVYENGYLLRDLMPPNFTDPQPFFSNQFNDFFQVRRGADAQGNSVVFGERLNNSDQPEQNNAFTFSKNEIKIVETNEEEEEVITRFAPGIWMNLNKDFFQKKIIDGFVNGNLANPNVFKNYFRGILFQLENSDQDPNPNQLSMINFRGGRITITYDDWVLKVGTGTDTVPAEYEKVEKEYVLTLTGNNTVFMETISNNPTYANAIANPNTTLGDEKLYLKGGAGSMAVIELFGRDGQGLSQELTDYKDKNWLINEANLTFYVDRDAMQNSREPNRILLYDLDNNNVIVDYSLDQTTNPINPKFNKSTFGGIITKVDNRGFSYKIRLTTHIRNILKDNKTNVRLGLVVTENVNNINLSQFQNTTTNRRIPTSSVIHPFGTILYGNNTTTNDKKLKLEIFYTKL